MTRRRVYTAKFREVTIESASKLLTLEDPNAKISAKAIRGVFVRLRPPPDTAPEVVERWRASVAEYARAVKVLPTPRSAVIAQTSTRVEEPTTRVDVRAVVASLVEESTSSDKPALHAFAERIMSEVGL